MELLRMMATNMRQTREAGKEKQEGMRMVPMTLVLLMMQTQAESTVL